MPHWLRLESGKRAFKTYLTDIKQTVFLLRVGEKRTTLDKTYLRRLVLGGRGWGGGWRRADVYPVSSWSCSWALSSLIFKRPNERWRAKGKAAFNNSHWSKRRSDLLFVTHWRLKEHLQKIKLSEPENICGLETNIFWQQAKHAKLTSNWHQP